MADIESGPVVGLNCRMYYNNGSHGTPSWIEMTKAIDVGANLGKGEGDVSARFSKFKLTKGALKDWEFTFGYRHIRGTDTVFDKILDSYVNGTPVEFAIMDGDISLSKCQGPRAYCEVFQMDMTQELENGEEFECSIKPTYKEDPAGTFCAPDWYEVP